MYPDSLFNIFQNGSRFLYDDPWKTSLIRTSDVGEVVIASGHIVVTCPYLHTDWPPFAQTFPTGRFPVVESFQYLRPKSGAWLQEPDPETIPYELHQSLGAVVRFHDSEPGRWELATLPEWPDEEVRALDLQHDYYGGWLNEHGNSLCFMDAEVAHILTGRINQNEAYFMQLLDQIEEDELNPFVVDEASGGNLVAFGQGGQGTSPAFIGYAEDGRIVCLAVDVAFEARKLLTEGRWHPAE